MSPEKRSISRYEERVTLAADALMKGSSLPEEAAVRYAKQVLYAVDHIPEHMR